MGNARNMDQIGGYEPKIKMPDVVSIHFFLDDLGDIDPICKGST